MDDFEGVFEKEISRFIWAKCHIKLNHMPYIYEAVYRVVTATKKLSRQSCLDPVSLLVRMETGVLD